MSHEATSQPTPVFRLCSSNTRHGACSEPRMQAVGTACTSLEGKVTNMPLVLGGSSPAYGTGMLA